MEIVNNATAIWNGSIKDGKGKLSTASNTLNNVTYDYKMRFEESDGTNPEELIAAAHAGCFTMKLSGLLTEAGLHVHELKTNCEIVFRDGTVTNSNLKVTGSVSDIDQQRFQEVVNDAAQNCPISLLLNCDVNAVATLQS